MKRRFRLTRSVDFKRVRRLGKSYAHPLLVLVALPQEAMDEVVQGDRIGVTAGRSVGNAVKRNRAKRLIRAALQPYLSSILPGWDMVFIARQPLAEATFQQTQTALFSLLRRAHILKEYHDA